ncbi:fimbrillin family protein [Bacteroides propionicifaciens]|uniref:fimbrillin family protein n=1 Tax=Bacteroides propionicifaciens TaxID=392838 RepID=UPI00036C8439|nr:fimbrillin family protein [Bacteroides propionicifaciens]
MTKRSIQKAKSLFGGITVVSLFLSSCYNEIKEPLEDSDVPIRITTDILPPSTRVSQEKFETKDAIGFFLLTNTDNLNESYFKNIQFTFHEGEDFIPSKELYYPKTQDPSTIISYYPYKKDILTDEGFLRVSIKSNSSDKAKEVDTDFLIARKENVFADLKPQQLNFKHALAKVEVEIKPAQGYSAEEILGTEPLLKILNQPTEALFDTQKGIFTQHTNKLDLQPNAQWQVQDGIIKGCSFLYIPKEATSTDEQITILAENITYKCSFPKKWNLKAGTVNRLTINYTPSKGIEIAKAESNIKPWEKGENDEVNTQIETCAIQTTMFKFQNTNVYRLVNSQGIIRAQVCRELLVNKEMKTEAVVIYPIDKDLKVANRGICLKTFNLKDNIVGDTIIWDKKDNSFSIAKHGSKVDNTYFFIDTQGEICFSEPKTPDYIHSEEVYLNSKKESLANQYPIVKIGTQYWTTENWKEEFKSDHTPLAFEKAKTVINAGYTMSSYCGDEHFYNRAAIESEALNPQGWAIPSTEEWKKLFKYIDQDYNLLKSGQWISATSPLNSIFKITPRGCFVRGEFKTDSNCFAAYDSQSEDKLTTIIFHNREDLPPLEIRLIKTNDYMLNIRLIKR